MSNRVHFTRTKFSDPDGSNATFGYRAADDYEMYYDDSWATPGPEDDMEFMHHIRETASERCAGFIRLDARETRVAATSNDDWHTIEEIDQAFYKLDEMRNFLAGNNADKEE